MPSIITPCCGNPDWLERALSKVAQFDELDRLEDDVAVEEVERGQEAGTVRMAPASEAAAKFYADVPQHVVNPAEWGKGGKRLVAVPQSAKNRVNKRISAIVRGYHMRMPWSEIIEAMSTEGLVPIDENGDRFGHGVLFGNAECGTEEAINNQRINMRVAVRNPDGAWSLTTTGLHLSWCVILPKGKYEVVCYVG